MAQTAQDINTLAAFCGVRSIPALTQAALQQVCGAPQVDVAVLFGGSILAGGDTFAAAMQAKVAKYYIIVGGAGHTTEALREKMRGELPHCTIEPDAPEAVLFDTYLKERYQLRADFLECASTNCGNNITYLLDVLQAKHIQCKRILLMQDATMQRRMAAALALQAPEMQIINFAAYQAVVQVAQALQHPALAYQSEIHGMWEMQRYITLLMGEIPRLTDDANGYGPNGSGFVVHVDIPQSVADAFARLQAVYTDGVRIANPAYAAPR